MSGAVINICPGSLISSLPPVYLYIVFHRPLFNMGTNEAFEWAVVTQSHSCACPGFPLLLVIRLTWHTIKGFCQYEFQNGSDGLIMEAL